MMQSTFCNESGYTAALSDLEKALRIEPNNEEVVKEYSNLQQNMEKSRKNEKAISKGFLNNGIPAVSPPQSTAPKISEINGMIAENAAAVTLFEKMRNLRKATKCKRNIAKLEKMKEDLEHGNKRDEAHQAELEKEIKELAEKEG